MKNMQKKKTKLKLKFSFDNNNNNWFEFGSDSRTLYIPVVE